MQKRYGDVGWSDEKKWRGCNKEEGTENTGRTTVCHGGKSGTQSRRNCATVSRGPKRRRKWQRGITSHPLDEGIWRKSHLTVCSWGSQKSKRWEKTADGFRDHVTTDGSLLGVPGRWSACLITTRRWGPCMERWMLSCRYCAPSRERNRSYYGSR